MSHIFNNKTEKKKQIVTNQNYFPSDELPWQKKVKIESKIPNLVQPSRCLDSSKNSERIPLIKDFDPFLYETNNIEIISSTNSLINKSPLAVKEQKNVEIVEEKVEEKEVQMKPMNKFDEIDNFIHFYNFYLQSMLFNPFNFYQKRPDPSRFYGSPHDRNSL